ncbi:MAG TPA: GH116 family glycosyl-hydrolase [Verrucomicrobiae bacterium]|nr:GH116 family glycosyl-hydrolase [Verrucomicrobiae bacterium]
MRKCKCSGQCESQAGDLTRREFLAMMGAATGAMLVPGSARAVFELPESDWKKWRQTLFETAPPRRYLSHVHTEARMHLGGIGTGNFEIGADGQLTSWQLFNTLRDGQIPFYFCVKAGNVAKLLQTAGGPDWPRVQKNEMSGEYPLAKLRFQDSELPVQVELDAFSPFVPLDADTSSLPLALFHFRVHNPTKQAQVVSLGALLLNPVGYDASGEIHGTAHPNFGGNVNEVYSEGQTTGLFLRAEPGNEPALDRSLCLYVPDTFQELKLLTFDRPENLKINILDSRTLATRNVTDSKDVVIWLDDASTTITAPLLRMVFETTRAGGTLIFSGRTMPLLSAYATVTGGKPLDRAALRPDVVFENFEHGYGKWTVEGEAFGREPARGTLPNQQPVSGFSGKGLVNSYLNGDQTTGRLTSRTFTVERNFICFRVGGGHYRTTQMRLVVGGKVVRATSGRDDEHLEAAFWDVREFLGRSAHIEIVDHQTGEWGHINIDQIVFADWPGDRELLELLDELLPVWFERVQEQPSWSDGLAQVAFQKLALRSGTQRTSVENESVVFTRRLGDGRVALVAGQVLDVARLSSIPARQMAYSILCGLAGAGYVKQEGQSAKAPGFGTLALATTGPDATGLAHFEEWSEAWDLFSKQGHFPAVETARANIPTAAGQSVHGALATTISVPPVGTVEIPFFFAWHYPNSYYQETGKRIGCHYATRWADARTVIHSAVANHESLRQRTELYHKTFYDSTLPYWLLDCLTANSGIMRHIGVVFRIANHDIYGWEGSNGCCTPTCTHVWGYEQSLARLFPELERDMRRIDFKHQQNPDGGINNRTLVPSPPHPTGEGPFADGHASCVLKAYREALNSSDESFFRDYWPCAKRAVEYLIHRDAKAANGQPKGILQDDQWCTYDEALHGVTTFISGYYLAALRAGEEWARRMNDTATAARFHGVFEKGQSKLVELCWNGEYFQQHLPDYLARMGEVGPGCMSDQLLGQWWAHQLGLGYLLPKEKVVSALRSIFKYNFKSDLTGWRFLPRAFAGAKDKGLIVCTWPRGGRPAGVMLYADEVWTGIEYQVASHLIYEGLLEEGLCVAKGARDRYDGVPRPPMPRNPWSEIECGGHYARALSSWSLLLAVSGYYYDGPECALGFSPRYNPDDFKSFFCAPEGWGSFTQRLEGNAQQVRMNVNRGTVRVKTLSLATANNSRPATVAAFADGERRSADFRVNGGTVKIDFGEPLVVKEREELQITISYAKM